MAIQGADGIDIARDRPADHPADRLVDADDLPGPELEVVRNEQPPTVAPTVSPPQVIDLREAPADDPVALVAARRPYLTARLLLADGDILAARRLHAEVFLRSGFVSADDVAPDGTIGPALDPWGGQSQYYAVERDGRFMVTARQINVADARDLPALGLNGLQSDEVRRIVDLPSGAAVEISALARARGAGSADVVAVYVRMWRESMQLGHRVWVMAVDVKVFQMLRVVLCGSAIREIGAHQEYMGSEVVPAVVWCDEIPAEHRRLAQRSTAPLSFVRLLPGLFPGPVGSGW